jgi:hypothetical protein
MHESPRQKLRALATLLALACLLSGAFDAPSSAQKADEERAAAYQKFLDNFRGDVEQQRLAYDAAREYLRKYSDRDDVGQYVKKWAKRYEAAVAGWKKVKEKIDLYQSIYDTQGADREQTYKLVKKFLKKYPDDERYAPSLRRWLQSYEGGAGPDGVPKIEMIPYAGMGVGTGVGPGRGYDGGVAVDSGRAYGGTGEPTAEATPSQGRYYALVIGNSNYRHVAPLKTAAEDARAVEAALRQRYGFETTLLLDADRRQVVSALNSFRPAAGGNANLLVYYAGHGRCEREADKGYWLPVDARPDDKAGWISADDVNANAKAVPAPHVLIVADSCYSGAVGRAAEPRLSELSAPPARDKFIEKMYAAKSRTLMASGGSEPAEDGVGGKHSLFAAAFLRGLSEMGPETFTATELFRDYVRAGAAGTANRTPEYNPLGNSGHDGGDFVFVRRQQ